ncbi:MAG: UDP-N-acetylenolpyruvoylglucosamine reductase, partial [Cyanobacteria bacterium P01_H01_bin.121]
AGWLIEQSGLKGYRVGNAEVSQRHANFIVNQGGASAADVWQIIRHVQATIFERWSTVLETEVKLLGRFDLD